jgi:hypothetical protein
MILYTQCCSTQKIQYGQWFSPGTPDSSTTKTGRNDIAEILLKAKTPKIK